MAMHVIVAIRINRQYVLKIHNVTDIVLVTRNKHVVDMGQFPCIKVKKIEVFCLVGGV